MKKDKKIHGNKLNDIPPEELPEYLTVHEYASLSQKERAKWQPVPPKYEKVPLFCKISLLVASICLIIYLSAIFNTAFADWFNRYVGSAVRFVLAKISGILPFSIAEFLLILIIPFTVGYIIYAMKRRSQTWKMVISVLSVPVAVLACVLSLFVINLGTGYRTSTLDKKLDFEKTEVNKENLYQSAEYLTEQLNLLSQEIDFRTDRLSIMPYSFEEMNEKLLDAYDKFCEKNSFIATFDSNLKPVMLSTPMSYLHTLGIYTFFTGEANININFPDYTIPFTSAHELAHQRGISRENEANMIAFLVCMESDDVYIKYSAYLNMYEYVATALAETDTDMYKNVRSLMNEKTVGEEYAYSNFFSQYRNSSASTVSSAINDTFLKSQGTEGEISYELVVELTVSYFKSQNIID